MSHQTIKNRKYGNHQVLDNEQKHIFNCGDKKRKWYLDRGLAIIVSTDPSIIQLIFTPNGKGRSNEPFFLAKLEDRCVVCGSPNNLTRHHLVPFCFRQWFPLELKSHNHYDVLMVCVDCHHTYEATSQSFKTQLAKDYGVWKQGKEAQVYDKERGKVVSAACALMTHSDKIPKQRLAELRAIIEAYYERPITEQDIIDASKITYQFFAASEKTEAQLIVERIDDFDAFIIMWRQHFITHTKPQYLPSHWEADKRIEKTQIKKSNDNQP